MAAVPQPGSLEQEARAAALRARARLAAGRISDALPHLRDALRLDPARALDWLDPEGLYGERATRPIDEAVRFGQHAFGLLNECAEEFRARGRIDLCASALQSALAVYPGRADTAAALERTIDSVFAALSADDLPSISIVTPSFNQAPFLAECIESVLGQGYPRLEYIVLDGGSTDGSPDIVRRYADRLAYWRSAPDGGQYAAITEGLQRATGDVLAWINSDDRLWPWTLKLVGLMFAAFPHVEWLTGRRNQIGADGRLLGISVEFPAWSHNHYARRDAPSAIQQEGTFWRRGLWERAGGYVGGEWGLAGDYDLWLRFMRHATLHQSDLVLGAFRTGRAEQRSLQFGREYVDEVVRIGAGALAWARENTVRGTPAELVRLSHLVAARRDAGSAGLPGGADIAAELRRAVAMHQSGDLDGAAGAYARVLERRPEQPDALNLLGVVHAGRGRPDEALALLERACAADPKVAPFHANRGQALLDLHRLEEAEAAFSAALRLDPRSVDGYAGLAKALSWQGRTDEAASVYERGARETGDAGLALSGALLVPVIPRDAAEIDRWRARVSQSLASLAGIGGRVRDPVREIDLCGFYLAYHGLPNGDLHRAIAARLLEACPELAWMAPHCEFRRPRAGRLRIGILSKFLRGHSIGRTTRGLVEQLDRQRFEVIAISIPPLVDDDLSRAIRGAADRFVPLPRSLEAAREAIAALELDVLFYQDIGMEPVSYFLSFARLAPVQCVSFGHPDTTGVPNMDWFVSSAGYEPEGATEHYTEQLHLLRGVGPLAYYHRPVLPERPRDRAALGLGDAQRLYACPQAAFKFHPAFDAVLGDILRRDPGGVLALVDSVPAWGRLLRARLAAALPDVIDRIRFLPAMPGEDFLALLAAADVVLDTPHFNGMNSTLEALAVGTPVVTWPQALQRGRHGLGLLSHIGLEDCIVASAGQYVETALHIARDAQHRAALRGRILERGGALFEDAAVVRQFEDFFEHAHARASAVPGAE